MNAVYSSSGKQALYPVISPGAMFFFFHTLYSVIIFWTPICTINACNFFGITWNHAEKRPGVFRSAFSFQVTYLAMHYTAFSDIIQTFQLLSPVCAFDVACGTVRSLPIPRRVSLKLTMCSHSSAYRGNRNCLLDPHFGVYYLQGHQGAEALAFRPLGLVGKTTQIHVQACLSQTQWVSPSMELQQQTCPLKYRDNQNIRINCCFVQSF